MALARAVPVLDFLVRLAFFAAAPFLLVFVGALFPVTGALAQIGIGLAAFFAGEALRGVAARSRLAALALSSQLAFEAHYRKHPPRPFLYYVFYPVLFPYWLSVPDARSEFLLFKGYTLFSFAMLIASQAWGYYTLFPPQLGFADFWPLAVGAFLVETAVVLMFMMPMVTSVVHFHRLGARWRVAALLVAAAVSVTFAVSKLESRRDPMVSFATRRRVDLRTHARPTDAAKAQEAALRAAWRSIGKDSDDIAKDGKVVGEVLEEAQAALQPFYRPDEANSFDLWYTRRGKSPMLVLYFEARGKKDPIWLAMTRPGAVLHDAKQLPADAFNAMWRLTQ